MRFHTCLILSLILVLPATASAQGSGPYPYPGYQPPTAQENPGVVLRAGIDKVLAFLDGGGASQRDKLVSFVERELAGYFDFVSMTRWSMGPQLQYLNTEQRREAVDRLRGMFLHALVRQLTNYEPDRVQYLPPRGNPYSNEMVLSIQTYPRSGYPHRLDFYFYRGRSGWKIFDVASDGLRATSVYREHFRRSRGPDRQPAYYPSR